MATDVTRTLCIVQQPFARLQHTYSPIVYYLNRLTAAAVNLRGQRNLSNRISLLQVCTEVFRLLIDCVQSPELRGPAFPDQTSVIVRCELQVLG